MDKELFIKILEKYPNIDREWLTTQVKQIEQREDAISIMYYQQLLKNYPMLKVEYIKDLFDKKQSNLDFRNKIIEIFTNVDYIFIAKLVTCMNEEKNKKLLDETIKKEPRIESQSVLLLLALTLDPKQFEILLNEVLALTTTDKEDNEKIKNGLINVLPYLRIPFEELDTRVGSADFAKMCLRVLLRHEEMIKRATREESLIQTSIDILSFNKNSV